MTRRHKSLDLEWLNLEAIYEGVFDSCRANSVGENDFYRRSSARQPSVTRNSLQAEENSPHELLRCLLVAKDVLERKNKDPSAAILAAIEMSQGFERDHSNTQQLTLKRQTLIRQRKNSTAIKVASLEKRKSLQSFKDGERESLQRRLTALDLELKENERVAEIQKKRLFTRHNSDISALRDLGGIEMMDSNLNCLIRDNEFHRGSLPSLDTLPSFSEGTQDKKRIFGFLERRKTTRPEKRFRHILDSKIWKNRKQKSNDDLVSEVMSKTSSHADVSSRHLVRKERIEVESATKLTGNFTPKRKIRTRINADALHEIEKFKLLISHHLECTSEEDALRIH